MRFVTKHIPLLVEGDIQHRERVEQRKLSEFETNNWNEVLSFPKKLE